MRLPRITINATILFGDPPVRPALYRPYWELNGGDLMAANTLFVPISPVNPSDNVTGRTVTQTDSTGASLTFLYDPTVVMHTASADDSLTPYTFTCVDTNAVGNSLPSTPVTLGPPTPPPPAVPATPVMGTPQWGTPPSGSRVVDCRGK
jgi:hypothetical protein